MNVFLRLKRRRCVVELYCKRIHLLSANVVQTSPSWHYYNNPSPRTYVVIVDMCSCLRLINNPKVRPRKVQLMIGAVTLSALARSPGARPNFHSHKNISTIIIINNPINIIIMALVNLILNRSKINNGVHFEDKCKIKLVLTSVFLPFDFHIC